MAKKNQIQRQVESIAKISSVIDSSTHRVHPSRGRTFNLKQGTETLPVFVKIQAVSPKGNSLSTLAKKNGRYELTIPIRKGQTSMLSMPITVEHNGRRYVLAALASPSLLTTRAQRVSLSLYSEDGD